jgi:hypothetical protein
MAVNGLELITPTSIVVTGSGSSATINAGGSVTFTTAATLSLNGVFTSDYDNYVIDMRGSGTTEANTQIRLRLAGTDSSTGYTYQQLFADATSVTGSRFTSTAPFSGYISAVQRSGDNIYIYGPALAQPTAGRNVNAAGRSSAAIVDYAWTHSVSTAYDGLTLFPQAGSSTGLIKVYGLAQ